MKAFPLLEPSEPAVESMRQAAVEKVTGRTSQPILDSLAIEEPLEIQLSYGPSSSRQTRSISVTMRTPGNDFDLAAGFLMTEGVIQDTNDIEQIAYARHSFIPSGDGSAQAGFQAEYRSSGPGDGCCRKTRHSSTQLLYNIELRHLR